MSVRKRLIPVLLVDRHHRLVKTVKFRERTYIGDPFNVVRLFNEKEVDEIVVLDIDAATDGRQPDYDFLKELASECFMPLAYGGGISSLSHCEKLNHLGVEKFVFGRGAHDKTLIVDASNHLGSQAVVGCVDVTGGSGRPFRCATQSGTVLHDFTPVEAAQQLAEWGAGEIILQSIERDGVRQGMDLSLINEVSGSVSIPVVALGGAGDLSHLAAAMESGASAVASGSAFCFIGRLRAVLVTYPTRTEVDAAVRLQRGGA
ncbi:MAG: HisA/HisF-related TIM barrel protein [Rubrivivax sp.]|jgi:cyclase